LFSLCPMTRAIDAARVNPYLHAGHSQWLCPPKAAKRQTSRR
jgi:hypothetical protein